MSVIMDIKLKENESVSISINGEKYVLTLRNNKAVLRKFSDSSKEEICYIPEIKIIEKPTLQPIDKELRREPSQFKI